MKRDAEFFGDQLHLSGGHALPEFFFSGVGGDAAVRGDGDPGIDLARRRSIRRRSLPAELGPRIERRQDLAHAEADNQCAGSLQERPAGKSGAFQGIQRVGGQRKFVRLLRWSFHRAISCFARPMARSIRVCVKHRQSTRDIAS